MLAHNAALSVPHAVGGIPHNTSVYMYSVVAVIDAKALRLRQPSKQAMTRPETRSTTCAHTRSNTVNFFMTGSLARFGCFDWG